MGQRSFTKAEREFRGEFRTKINAAESTEDVRKFFFQTVLKFLNEVFQGKVSFAIEDVLLDAGRKEGFRFRDSVMGNEQFREVWEGSDLRDIIRRFAETCQKRMIHLEKHPEKTEAKMYHSQ